MIKKTRKIRKSAMKATPKKRTVMWHADGRKVLFDRGIYQHTTHNHGALYAHVYFDKDGETSSVDLKNLFLDQALTVSLDSFDWK